MDYYPLFMKIEDRTCVVIGGGAVAARKIEMLRRAVLPAPRPPPFPIVGVNIPARTVSGDFFDILTLEDGRIGFCLGDVSGKGMNAAMLMAKTASLYRCLAKTTESPGALLALLNDEICETVTRGMFVTMMAGIYDPRDGGMRLANAGHEPPLHHRPGGTYHAIPADAPPLGIVPESEFPETEMPMGGGSLYVFSDGLTEACSESGDQLGSEGLQQMVDRFASKPLSERVDAIMADVRQLELRDDLTLLVVSDERPRDETTAREAAGKQLLDFRVSARPEELKRIRTAVREQAEACGCNPQCAGDIVLAVDEACQNIIRHAYGDGPAGEIQVSIEHRGGDLIVELRDFAPSIDPDRVQPRDLDDVRPGGLGTHFIRTVMDDVEFIPPPSGRGNLLRMIKRIQ